MHPIKVLTTSVVDITGIADIIVDARGRAVSDVVCVLLEIP